MKHNIPFWQMAGFVLTGILGTLLHFLFDWTGGNALAGVISAVNESIWEHMKLLFYPMVLFALVEYGVWGKQISGFWCIKLAGILLGLGLIPLLYYGYTGILGVSADWFNITIFFLAAGASYWVETQYFRRGWMCVLPAKVTVTVLCLTALAFSLWTFVPPRIPLFQDPLTGTYGFQQG